MITNRMTSTLIFFDTYLTLAKKNYSDLVELAILLYIQNISKGLYPGQSIAIVKRLPIIDLDPTDMNCIHSALVFITKQATELKVETPVVTFKGTEIVQTLDLKIVLILGRFHMMLSFAGSVGTLLLKLHMVKIQFISRLNYSINCSLNYSIKLQYYSINYSFIEIGRVINSAENKNCSYSKKLN